MAVVQGGRGCYDATLPRIFVSVWQCLMRGHGSFIGNNGQRTNNNQKLTNGWLLTRGYQCRAPPNPPQKDTICRWDWGEGVAGFNLTLKERAGDAIIMRWTMMMMTTMTMARGGSKGKSINDSISEHECIVTSNIIYSITIYTNKLNNNFSSVSVTTIEVGA